MWEPVHPTSRDAQAASPKVSLTVDIGLGVRRCNLSGARGRVLHYRKMLSCGVSRLLLSDAASPWIAYLIQAHRHVHLSNRNLSSLSPSSFLQARVRAHCRSYIGTKERDDATKSAEPCGRGLYKRMSLPSAALLASLAFFARALFILQSLILRTNF